MRTTNRSLAIGVLALLLAGCSLLSGGANAALDGEWQLQNGSNQGAAIPNPPGRRITLTIDGADVGGISACNHYGGTLDVSGTTIRISALGMTEMACIDDGVMAAEAAYLDALPRATGATRSGNSLVLRGPQVELRFALVPPVPNAALVGTAWVLQSLISGDAVSSTSGDPATLQLNADGSLTASTGCREVTGSYTISGTQVQVTLDPYDLVGCADPVGAQDVQVLAVIGSANGFSVAIGGNSMTLTATGQGLGYRVVAAGS
ncbi:MAG: META domain-containing protein [Candidatus Limnocylindria bacterium]